MHTNSNKLIGSHSSISSAISLTSFYWFYSEESCRSLRTVTGLAAILTIFGCFSCCVSYASRMINFHFASDEFYSKLIFNATNSEVDILYALYTLLKPPSPNKRKSRYLGRLGGILITDLLLYSGCSIKIKVG